MARKSWLASVQGRVSLLGKKEGEEERRRDIWKCWREFKRVVGEDGDGGEDASEMGGQDGQTNDDASILSIYASSVGRSIEEVSHHATILPSINADAYTTNDHISESTGHIILSPRISNSTSNDRQSESTGRIVVSPCVSIDVPSEPATHPDFDNLGSKQVTVPKPCRLVKLLEERIVGRTKNMWPQRRLSMRAWKKRAGMGGKEGATKSTDEEDSRAKPVHPTPIQKTEGSKEPAPAYKLFFNAARGIEVATSTTPPQSQNIPPPLRLKRRFFNQTSQHPADYNLHPHLSSSDKSPPSPSLTVVSPTPNSSLAPELQALFARVDHSASHIQLHGMLSPPNAGSIPSLVSTKTPSTVSSPGVTKDAPQRSPSEQALWTQCGSRLDIVAAEAAERTRSELRRQRIEKVTSRPEEVVQKAVVLKPAKPKLVFNRSVGRGTHAGQNRAISLPEMQEKKTKLPWVSVSVAAAVDAAWEDAWHNPPKAPEDELIVRGVELSTTTLATMDYTVTDAAFRFPRTGHMRMGSGATLVEEDVEEKGEDWYSCYEQWQDGDEDSRVRTPLLGGCSGRL